MFTPLCNIFAPLLAQATTPPPKSTEMDIMITLAWLVVGAAVIVVIGVIVFKRISAKRDERNTGIAFSITELRRMHRDGQLTDEEFERAKKAIIANSSFVMNEGAGKDENG